ncbi:sugar ABC transporter permease [Clostridia bacterium]|nr:sugar ABC transporter permease [Clostridia bacterium]
MQETRMRRLTHQISLYWQLFVFLIPPLVYIVLFHYIPMFGVQIAFKQYSPLYGIWNSPWVGLLQFRRFFSGYMFGRLMRNTVVISLYSLGVGFPIPVIFALALNVMTNKRYQKIVQMVSYAPHFISIIVLVGLLNVMLGSRTGMYGAVVKMFTGGFPSDLFSNPATFRHMYVWSGIWQQMGWSAVIYIASLSAVDTELHEAAEIDGASRLSRVWHIDLPSILPTLSIMLILACGSILSVGFEKVYLMQNNINTSVSEVISTYVYKVALVNSPDFSYSTAIGFFNSVINLAFLVVVNAITGKLSQTSLF